MALTSYPVSPLFWNSCKRKKWDEFTKNLALYFLTCRHRNLEGLYHLPKLYMASDNGWTLEQLSRPFQTILEDGFVMFDEEVEVILLPKALSFYAPKSDNQIKGAKAALSLVPDTALWPHFLRAAKTYAEAFYNELGGDEELALFETDPTHTDTHSEGLIEAA